MALGDILQAPINTILILAGIAFAFFGLFDVSKGNVKLRGGSPNFVPLALGAALILGGIFINPGRNAEPAGTPAPTDLPATQPPVQAATIPVVTTEAPAATSAPTDTPEPTQAPVVKTLLDGCFGSQAWQAKSINSDLLSKTAVQDNCLNANSLGISVEPGGKIRLLANAPKTKTASGIFMPISDQSTIEFKFEINSLYIIYPEEAAYATFGISPVEDPMAERGGGRFKFVVERTGSEQTIFYFLANADQSFGSKWPSQHPSYNRTYSVKLVLKNISMEIYIDGNKLKDEVTIPPGAKVLYIGYYLPVQAGVDIEITDLTVNSVSP